MNFQDAGQPKPGAVVLVDAKPTTGGRVPLLVTQNFGRGRTAIFATGGSWRWQMLQPLADKSHEMFYQQLLRWLVSDTPRKVITSTPKQLISDDSHVSLRAEVRDRTYLPASDAKAEAHILGPDGIAEAVEMRPDPIEAGVYTADWTTPKPGSYLVEVVATRGSRRIGPRHHDVPPRRRRGREFPHPAESRAAGETIVGNRRPLLHAARCVKIG